MHTFLISHQNSDRRKQSIQKQLASWHIDSIDQISMGNEPREPLGIARIRELIQRLSISPLRSSFVVAIIYNAHSLSIEAQQAILKTLEEPPPRAKIFLETPHPDTLLPTILSRVQRLDETQTDGGHLTHEHAPYHEEFAHSLLSLKTISEAMTFVDSCAEDKETLQERLESWIYEVRQALLGVTRDENPKSTEESAFLTRLARQLLSAHQKLHHNVSPKVLLDHVCLWIVDHNN